VVQIPFKWQAKRAMLLLSPRRHSGTDPGADGGGGNGDGGGGGGSGGGGGGGGRGGEAQDSSGPVSLARTESRGRAGALEAENARLKAATADLEEKLLSATKELMVREGEVPEPTTRNVNEMITAIHKEVEKLFDQPAKVRKRSL
jgi:hypothetical protein